MTEDPHEKRWPFRAWLVTTGLFLFVAATSLLVGDSDAEVWTMAAACMIVGRALGLEERR